jgi:hypothetical protein
MPSHLHVSGGVTSNKGSHADAEGILVLQSFPDIFLPRNGGLRQVFPIIVPESPEVEVIS